jgi:hypothetical protein
MIRHRVSRLDLVGPRGIARAFVCAMVLAIAVPAVAQTPGWNTWWTDNTYYKPNYPLAFVVVPRDEVPNSHGGVTGVYNTGADVLTANQPSAGAALYLYLPSDGTVVKLFPRAEHLNHGQIDFDPSFGAVVEPSLSEDGTKIYFSYYHDARIVNYTTCYPNGGECLLWTGADIYSIDISSWLTNTQTNPDNYLFVKRLTTRSYLGPGSRKQAPADRDKDAMNIPSANAASNSNQYGTSFLHPTEMRTKYGLSLVFVSDERRLEHSNFHMGRLNHNFNLFIADLLPDGSLGPAVNQFQYYTTSSALSPTPLREGIAFSYQGTTEDGRNWHIQSIDSLGHWNTLLGYGSNPELFHLATLCVGNPNGGPLKDYLVAAKYYNGNNQGFGSLWRQDLDPAVLGQNTYNNYENGYLVPYQVGSAPISLGATSQDGISLEISPGVYYGKLTTPRCGGVNELYFTHTQTSANGRDYDPQGNRSLYKGYIGFRNSLASWPVNDISPTGHLRVIRSRNDIANLVWPLPIIPWSVRTNGDTVQQFSTGSIVNNHPYIRPGQPYAQLGSASISNTDRRPFECRLNGHPFNEWGSGTGTGIGNENDRVVRNQAGWNVLPANGAPYCNVPDPAMILGIEVNITSNRKDLATDIQNLESKRLLGIYDVRSQNPQDPNDTSFRTIIPANTPIELQLIEKNYGMKLTDVPSWHSLKAREMRVTCGGCHQHEAGVQPTPWDGTYASHNPPSDLVGNTPKLKYDAHCQPVMVPGTSVAAETLPEWKSDVWPGMVANCSSCHQFGGAGATPASLAALNWNGSGDEASVYNQIAGRKFTSVARGALGSQLFWAARGQRTDNRNNALPSYASHYDCDPATDPNCNDPAYRWGFHFGSAHVRFDLFCSSGDQALADWIFTLGKWIDNSMPRDIPGWLSKADRFHPTADVAISDGICNGTQMWAGWWDEGNELKSVTVSLISGGSTSILFLKQAVGSAWFPNSSDTDPPFPVTATLADSDVVSVEVIDSSDNRQIYKKTVEQLKSECALPVMADPEYHP